MPADPARVQAVTPPVLNVKDAAAYLAVSVSTMYRLSAQCGTGKQELPVVHVGHRRVFKVPDLDAYLARQTQTADRPVLRRSRRPREEVPVRPARPAADDKAAPAGVGAPTRA